MNWGGPLSMTEIPSMSIWVYMHGEFQS